MGASSRRVPALVLAAAGLAGCVLEECGPTDAATWIQPGLHDALLASGRDVEARAPPSGFPAGERLAALYGEGATIDGVHDYASAPTRAEPWRPLMGASLVAHPQPRLLVVVPVHAGEVEAVELLRGFARNVSLDPAQWDDWEASLLAQMRAPPAEGSPNEPRPASESVGSRTYEIDARPPFRLPALARELRLDEAVPDGPPAMPGEAHPAQGASGRWRLDIRMPVLEHEARVPEGRLRLMVDPIDQTFGYVEHDEASDPLATRERFARLFDELGVGAPHVTPGEFQTMVC